MSEDGELPEGWSALPLGRVIEPGGIFDGPFGSSLKTDDYTDGGVRVIRLENLANLHFVAEKETFISEAKYRTLTKHTVAKNDLLVGSFVDGAVRVCVVPELATKAIAKADCFCVRTDTRIMDRQFTAFQLGRTATKDALGEEIHGATRPRITTKQLRDLPVSIPPLPEQHRIVEKVEALLDQVNKAKDRLDRVHGILKRFRQAVLAAACSGKLTEEWREGVLKATSVPKTDDDLPARWQRRTVGELVEVATGATPLRKNPAYYDGGKVPWIKSGAVNRDPILAADEFITEKAIRETNAKVFPPGTLVMAMYGEGATRGKVAELAVPAATNQALAALLFSKTTVSLRPFLKLALQSQYASMREDAAGGVQPNLSLGAIREIEVDVPPPQEQAEIVRLVQKMFALADTIETCLTTASTRAEKLPQAILSKAFKGELVPTEAELARAEGRSLESAEEMLKRVMAEGVKDGSSGSAGTAKAKARGSQPSRLKGSKAQ